MNRHKWFKLRLHVYICRKCGTGKVNAQRGAEWFTTYHMPTGRSVISRHTPPCIVGIRTPEYLAKYASELAAKET